MITRIFSKSKPINLIIVFFIIAIACTVSFFTIQNNTINLNAILNVSALFVGSCFAMLVLNFVSGKNSLTQTNNFEIVLYGLFLLMIPQTTASLKLILANIFLLFSLRRLISLRSQKEVKKKLFDAAFWMSVAALFYSWTVLFFILVPVTIFLYTDSKPRNWLIPLTAILAVLLIAYSVCFLMGYNLMYYVLDGFKISFDFSVYNTPRFLIGLTVLLSFGLWALLFYVKNINLKKKSFRPAFYIIICTLLLSFFILVIAPQKSGSEVLFMFAPLAIIISSYIEIIREKWFKEVFFAILFLTPIIVLFL
jgi:hypothetical protein